MKKPVFTFGLAMFLGLGAFFACTKEVDSKPQFIFKPAPNNEAAAKVNGKVITFDELLSGVESDVYEAEMKVYEIKYNQLRALVLKKFMEGDSNYKGDNDKFLNEYIAKGLVVSDKEVNAFVLERKIPKNNLNEQLTTRIKQFLLKEKKQKAIDTWIAKKTQDSPVEVYLQKPTRPVKDIEVGDSPFMGGADAKVTIVEFSDFQCPFCSRGAEIMTGLKKKYGNKIKVVFKHYPLPFHTMAPLASEAALCAEDQKKGNFWKMHDLLFADQQNLAKPALIEKAKKVGVKVEDFTKCLDSRKFKSAVDRDMQLGQKVGVKSTPTFFVNGKMVNGAQPIEVFSEIIDEDLAK